VHANVENSPYKTITFSRTSRRIDPAKPEAMPHRLALSPVGGVIGLGTKNLFSDFFSRATQSLTHSWGVGSGQKAISALETGRQYVGYDYEARYVNLANQRLGKDMSDLNGFLQGILKGSNR
jgi:hypothetical protein